MQGRLIEQLGRAIVGGRFAPGEVLPREAELMEEFGVSRTTLREAMKVLAAKGLIEAKQKSGTSVRQRNFWNVFDSDLLVWYAEEGQGEAIIHDLVELRQMLEPSAARLAANRASMSDLKRIDEAHRAMEASVDDHDRYAQSDVAFHMALFAASHNALLERFGHLVADFLHLSFDLQQRAQRKREPVRDFTEDMLRHREVFDAVNRSDPDAAAAAMLEVILDGKRNLIDAVESLDDSGA